MNAQTKGVDVSPRVALNVLNSLIEGVERGHVKWASFGNHMVICERIDLPVKAFEFWLDGTPITMRALADYFGIDTSGVPDRVGGAQ